MQRENSKSQGQALILGLLAWLVPGLGHFAQGKLARGALLGGSVIAMFLCGMLFDGRLYSVFNFAEGLLHQAFGAFNLGAGLLYVVCWLSDTGFTDVGKAEQITFEYGNTMMMVSGLMNYLAMLDAYDVAIGRKA